MQNIHDSYSQLAFYTLNLGDSDFIHQLIVDAYAAQNATTETKPITLTFALVGLYLVNEKGYTGKQVQNTHITLAKANTGKIWPKFDIPSEPADIDIYDVIQLPDNEKQDMIKKWNRAVWESYKGQQKDIEYLLTKYFAHIWKIDNIKF